MSQLCPGAVLQKLDKLVEPLKLTCTTKVKANSVKQEYEKQDELKRSAMRAVASLMNIAGADKHPQLNEFITQIKSTPDLANLFESIQKDSGDSLTNQMDLSWGGGRRDAGKEIKENKKKEKTTIIFRARWGQWGGGSSQETQKKRKFNGNW